MRFAVTGDAILAYACHCHGCQKLTSSAFTLSAWFPVAQFEFIEGETEIGGAHHEHRQIHCAYCKGWGFTDFGDPDGFVSVRQVLLDRPDAFPPLFDRKLDEALPGVRSGAVREMPDNFPDIPGMAAEYAAFLADRRKAQVRA